MAIALLSHTVKAIPTSGATNAIDTTNASLLVAAQAQWGGAGIAAFSDSKGNVWTALTARRSTNNYLRMFWCRPTSVGSGHTFNLTGSSTFYGALAVAAFSGATALPFDGENGQFTQPPITSYSPGSITPTQNNDLIITAISNGGGSGATIDQAFNIIDALNWGSTTNEPVALAYRLQSIAATITPTWTWITAGEAAAAIAAFRSVTTGQIVSPDVADSVYSVGVTSLALVPSHIAQMSLVSAPRAIGAVTRASAVVTRTIPAIVSAPRTIGHVVVADSSTVVRPMTIVAAPQTVGAVTWSQVTRALSLVSAPSSIGVPTLTSAETANSRQMAMVSAPRVVNVVTPWMSIPIPPPEPPTMPLHFSGTVEIPAGTDFLFSGTVDVPAGTFSP